MAIDMIIGFFQNLINSVHAEYRDLVSLFLYTIFIAIYAVFIWKFYKFLASRDIISLNLKQYNYSKHPKLEKLFAIGLYTIEFMVILPFLVLFWFTILSLFLLLLSETQSTQQILLISAAIISSTRITAYINENLSMDLAKILPFTVLATFILDASFLKITSLLDKFSQIPLLFNNIVIFIVFIFAVEFVFRLFYSTTQFFVSSEEENEKEVEKVNNKKNNK